MLVLTFDRKTPIIFVRLPDGQVGEITLTQVVNKHKVRVGLKFPKSCDIRRNRESLADPATRPAK